MLPHPPLARRGVTNWSLLVAARAARCTVVDGRETVSCGRKSPCQPVSLVPDRSLKNAIAM